MEIKNVNLKQELAEIAKKQKADVDQMLNVPKSESKNSFLDFVSVDTAAAGVFDSAKSTVANSTNPSRTAYVDEIKAKVESGNFELSGFQIADAMIEDGILDFLL
ncbi:MAG: flagellar biosynthesis anti-sigma factor FlgM [Candidatus Caenarcaniphilales bacterium]|jgi:anti-sigma28 factor (negative regulator of flagellin synthesis)|nr:flagellar biosynthesis anti-sigma factor FlgM [Candidatus Caenarcaniphilales bacterium]